MTQDWFEQTTWNPEIESMFFAKLSKAREWNKSRYLRIQAATLLFHGSPDYFPVALMLFNKVFNDYPDKEWDVMFSHSYLADFYLEKGQYDDARKHYNILYEYNEKSIGKKDSDTCKMGIAEIIIKQKRENEYAFAQKLLESMTHSFPQQFAFLLPIKKRWESLVEQLKTLQQS